MKFHRCVKRIECALTVHQNFCRENGDFGKNISEFIRELMRFLAAEDVQYPQVGFTNRKKIYFRLFLGSENKAEMCLLTNSKLRSISISKSGKFRIETIMEN